MRKILGGVLGGVLGIVCGGESSSKFTIPELTTDEDTYRVPEKI